MLTIRKTVISKKEVEGKETQLLAIGSGLTTGGVFLNAGLDYSEGKKLEAFSRIGIYSATLGLGKLIKKGVKAAKLEKTSEKILDSHGVIYGEIAEKTREKIFEKKK